MSAIDAKELGPKITVIGVGGAGGNAVNNMIRSQLEGVEFLVANTDAQSLAQSLVERRIQLGLSVTKGLGAGSLPDRGRESAEESLEEVMNLIRGANMLFVTAGMGGGTGTGAAPVIARAARELGILTIGVVTKPFHFEGAHRMRTAEKGIESLQQFVDTLIVIPNQNLFRVSNERTTFADAFKMADDVLYAGVRGVTDLMIMPGLINLDFADIRTVMSEMGKAMMGTGEASGENRAIQAAEAAISNPLLDDVSMKGARGVLINITGGMDLTLYEVDEAANRIREEVDPEANIIFGSIFDEKLNGYIRVSVVATGIDAQQTQRQRQMANQPTQLPQGTAKPQVPTNTPGFSYGVAAMAPQQGQTADFFDKAQPSSEGMSFPGNPSAGGQYPQQSQGQGGDNQGFGYQMPVNPPPSSQPQRQEPEAPKRAPSFLERLTGVARRQQASVPAPTPPASVQPTSPYGSRGQEFPSFPGGNPQDSTGQQQGYPQGEAQGQSHGQTQGQISGQVGFPYGSNPGEGNFDLATRDRLQGEQDLLEIPAFLRRQNNQG